MPNREADLLLVNARLFDLAPRRGASPAKRHTVAVKDGVVTSVATARESFGRSGPGTVDPGTRVIDCRGLTLIPGLVDAHCHLLALASSLRSLDCRPPAVSSIPQLQRALRQRALAAPSGRWVRGFGYDHEALLERRHPNRWDLDPFSEGRPVRLHHRSGHACVLNSRGLELAGISRDTPDPVDGVIERDPSTGEPTGLLLEMHEFLRRSLEGSQNPKKFPEELPKESPGEFPEEFKEGVGLLNRKLLECGITTTHDAGPGNDLARWQTFQELRSSGLLECRVTMMAGFPHLEEFREAGLGFGTGGDGPRLGHAKIMLTMTTGALHPGVEELEDMVRRSHRLGFPVAVHAVEREAVSAAAQALGNARSYRGPLAANDRIEHCSECPESLVAQVARSGADVVTQPGLVYWQGDSYLANVEPELIDHLYPTGALRRAGVNVAFGSDAPVTGPNPWPAIYGAVTRKTRSGEPLSARNSGGNTDPRVPVEEALQMYMGGNVAVVVY